MAWGAGYLALQRRAYHDLYAHPHVHTDCNQHADAYFYPDQHTNEHINTYACGLFLSAIHNEDADTYTHAHADSHTNADTDAYTDSHPDTDCNQHADQDTHAYGHCY